MIFFAAAWQRHATQKNIRLLPKIAFALEKGGLQ
jgi:hypothetical protein